MGGSWRRLRFAAVLLIAATVTQACSSGGATSGVQRSVFHLKAGDCVVTPTDIKAELTKLTVVPCREPHTQEVFALVSDNGGDNYPGATVLQNFANGACLQHFASYVGSDYRDSSLFYTFLLPSVRSWASGDHTIDCVVTTTGQKLTRSVKDSKL